MTHLCVVTVAIVALSGCGGTGETPVTSTSPARPPAPHGVQYVAKASVAFDTDPGDGEPVLQTRVATGQVDFDAHTGKMTITTDPVEPGDEWASGTITLDNQNATAGAFLGTPTPEYPSVTGDEVDASRDWDIATGLAENNFTPAPTTTGQRWTSSTHPPDVTVDFDDDQQFIQRRTLDVAADGTWTYTTVTYAERWIVVNRVVIGVGRAVPPPIDVVEGLLFDDPEYVAESASAAPTR